MLAELASCEAVYLFGSVTDGSSTDPILIGKPRVTGSRAEQLKSADIVYRSDAIPKYVNSRTRLQLDHALFEQRVGFKHNSECRVNLGYGCDR